MRIPYLFSQLSIRHKLQLGFGLLICWLILVAALGSSQMYSFKQQIASITQKDAEMVILSQQLAESMRYMEASLGYFLLNPIPSFEANYEQALESMTSIIARLRRHVLKSDEYENKDRLAMIQQNITKFMDYRTLMQQLAHHNNQNIPALSFSAHELNPHTLGLLQALSNLLQDEQTERQRSEILDLLHRMRYSWSNLTTALRGYIAFRNDLSWDNLELYLQEFSAQAQQLHTAMGDDPGLVQEVELDNMDRHFQTFRTNIPQLKIIHSGERWRQDAYLIRTEIAPLTARIHQDIAALVRYEQDKMKNRNQKILQQFTWTMIALGGILGLAILSSIWGVGWLVHTIVDRLDQAVHITQHVASGDLTLSLPTQGLANSQDEVAQVLHALQQMTNKLGLLAARLQESGMQLSASSTQIAATARQQSASAHTQAESATAISATSRAIAASAGDLVHTMNHITAMAERTADAAGNGQQELSFMEDSMHNMLSSTDAIQTKLQSVKEKTDNISNIIITISKIADQTNLLSLNAAIEAEKAGEVGRGFSVVAGETRRLADQTALATQDIEMIVKEAQNAMADSVAGMRGFSEQIRKDVNNIYHVSRQLAAVIDLVQKLIPQFDLARDRMMQQALDANQIDHSINDLSDAARETAESVSQSNQAIQQLNSAARVLSESVYAFKIRNMDKSSNR